MCPLMCCRCRFNDIPATLNHISHCPWISDGWYWCPFCSRPENLFENSKYGETGRPRLGWLRIPLQRRIPIFRLVHRFLMPWMTLSMPTPSELDASPPTPNRDTGYLSSTPELESIAHVVEIPANDPRWYYPEVGGVELLKLEAPGHDFPSSRSAETLIGTATQSAIQTMSLTTDNTKIRRIRIAELEQVFPVGCHEWILRLSADSSLVETCSKASPSLLFERGMMVLRGLITRKILKNFDDVFAMTHVLFDFSYTLHHDDGSCDWKGIIWDLHYWQRTVEGKIDPSLFSDALHQRKIVKDSPSGTSSRASFSSKCLRGSTLRDQIHS